MRCCPKWEISWNSSTLKSNVIPTKNTGAGRFMGSDQKPKIGLFKPLNGD